jgi:hypothetical protein
MTPEEEKLIAKCCKAAEEMLEFSGIHNITFLPEVMKEYIEKENK